MLYAQVVVYHACKGKKTCNQEPKVLNNNRKSKKNCCICNVTRLFCVCLDSFVLGIQNNTTMLLFLVKSLVLYVFLRFINSCILWNVMYISFVTKTAVFSLRFLWNAETRERNTRKNDSNTFMPFVCRFACSCFLFSFIGNFNFYLFHALLYIIDVNYLCNFFNLRHHLEQRWYFSQLFFSIKLFRWLKTLIFNQQTILLI